MNTCHKICQCFHRLGLIDAHGYNRETLAYGAFYFTANLP